MSMMLLGDFVFELRTATFQELRRQTPQRWSSHNRVGQRPAYQHLGVGDDVIQLPGVIYPEFNGMAAKDSLHTLRQMADDGKPYIMIADNTDQGWVLGTWIIENIEETQSHFLGSAPQKLEFTVHLKRYSDTDWFEYWAGSLYG